MIQNLTPEGKNEFVYFNWASHFWLSIQNVIFPSGYFFGFSVGGWFGLGGYATSTPRLSVDKQIHGCLLPRTMMKNPM